MGRPKTYDRETVARKAMELFWMHGYHATSTQMLTEHMGINRYSLFAEFGTKQGLFEVALELYDHDVVTRHFGRLEAPDAGLPELLAVFDFFAEGAKGPGAELGCFMTNVATERGPHDDESRVWVQAYIARIDGAVHNALTNAKERGELAPDVSVEDQSRLATAALLGLWVYQRARVNPEMFGGAARAVRKNLAGLSKGPVPRSE